MHIAVKHLIMIEFQYFEGCPSANVTLRNLHYVMSELGISEDRLKITNVPDAESANKLCFLGSPSILIDGCDIYSGGIPKGFNYACRIYDFNGGLTGIIPKGFIRDRLTYNKIR